MSFSSDLWNGFEILKNNYLHTYNRIKHFYEMMLSFASLEKSHSKNLEILFEQNKDFFNSDEILSLPSKTFISSLKIESEYHKYYYNSIFDNILSPLRDIIDNKRYLITKIFCDGNKNTKIFNNIIQNIITKQENYYNSCKDLSICLSEIEINTINTESKKKPNVNKILLNKKEKALEKVNRSQNEYLNIITESNVILKDYNLKTENLLNDLEKKFTEISTCMKDCLINYSKNKIQLNKDILEMANHGLNTCYEKIDIKNNIKDFIMKNATKEFKYHKFEYNPFNLNNINKNLLFKEENSKIKPADYDTIIQNIKKFFVDNKIAGTDSGFIEHMISSLNKIKLELNIKYDLLLDNEKDDENKNLIVHFPKNENNNIIINTNNSNKIVADKESEITNNLKLVDNFVNRLTSGGIDLDNDINKIKKLLQKKESNVYLEHIIKGINYYRNHGNYILKNKTYEYFLNLFIFILENFYNNDYVLKNLLTFSQTFYQIKTDDKNPKYYIFFNISNNPIFHMSEIWHRIINYSLTNYAINKDLANKKEKEEKNKNLENHIFNILVENLSVMKLFKVKEIVYEEVKDYYVQVYNVDNEKLNKEIDYFYKEKYFIVKRENDNQLIKGEDKTSLLIKNKDDDNDNSKENKENKETKDNKEQINEIKEENNQINIIKEEVKDEIKIIENNDNNENKINDNKDKKDN